MLWRPIRYFVNDLTKEILLMTHFTLKIFIMKCNIDTYRVFLPSSLHG